MVNAVSSYPTTCKRVCMYVCWMMYSDVVESLSGAAFVATLGQVGYRMKQHLTGTAILQLDSTTLGAIVVSRN